MPSKARSHRNGPNLVSLRRYAFLGAVLVCQPLAARSQAVVDNDPIWGSSVLVTEEVRIGRSDGAMEYLLGRVSEVMVTASGLIWVADGSVPVIRVFDTDGNYVRDVGREGEGPGEYQRIGGMQAAPGDRVAVYDPRSFKINLYEADGEFVEAHSVMIGANGTRVFQVDSAGHYYIRSVDMSRRNERGENGDPPMQFLVWSAAGEALPSIPIPSRTRSRGFVLITAAGYRGPGFDEAKSSVTRSGALIRSNNREYSFSVSQEGLHVMSFSRRYEPIQVSGEERAQWRAIRAGYAERNPERQFARIPSTKPAFRNFWIDMDNRIWVDRYTVAEKVESPSSTGGSGSRYQWQERHPTFDVMTMEGVFLGTVVLPPKTWIEKARGNLIWTTQEDGDGAPQVVRYRIN